MGKPSHTKVEIQSGPQTALGVACVLATSATSKVSEKWRYNIT